MTFEKLATWKNADIMGFLYMNFNHVGKMLNFDYLVCLCKTKPTELMTYP